jgi:two-component system chemotaxis response regulator CheV
MDKPEEQLGNELEIIEFFIDEDLSGVTSAPRDAARSGTPYRSYYGMNVAKVLEIIRKPQVTSVPGKHHQAALGTFNLRGKVLPLVDLALWLGKRPLAVDTDKVIVSEFSGVVTAFVVSGVTRIYRMTWAQVEPPGKYLQAFSHDSVTGVVRFDERIVFLLDMEQVIGSMDPSVSLSTHAKQVDSSGGEGLHVLIADDSPSIRNTIAACLEQAKFTVSKVTCGREAWEQLKKWEHRANAEKKPLTDYVNLVISDIEMPEVDGHTLTRKIKGDPALRVLPVILFSSLISEVVHKQGQQAGADDQIAKPGLPQLTERACSLIKKFQEKRTADA